MPVNKPSLRRHGNELIADHYFSCPREMIVLLNLVHLEPIYSTAGVSNKFYVYFSFCFPTSQALVTLHSFTLFCHFSLIPWAHPVL